MFRSEGGLCLVCVRAFMCVCHYVLTAATLPDAEIALTARVDCLRALRNILLGEVYLIL